MARYPAWSEKEDTMIRQLYPSCGARLTTQALRAEHLIRTEGAVKERAKTLGVRRDRSTIKYTTEGNWWSDTELDVLRSVFPTEGAEGVRRRLAALGHERTEGAITVRASMMGLKRTETKRRKETVGKTKIVNICLDSELDRGIIEHLGTKDNRSRYIRSLIEADMQGN